MSASRERRTPDELWSLQQAAVWVEARTDALQHRIEPSTVQELHEALKAGTITDRVASTAASGGRFRRPSGMIIA